MKKIRIGNIKLNVNDPIPLKVQLGKTLMKLENMNFVMLQVHGIGIWIGISLYLPPILLSECVSYKGTNNELWLNNVQIINMAFIKT